MSVIDCRQGNTRLAPRRASLQNESIYWAVGLLGNDGRGTLEARPEAGDPGDVELQIDVSTPVTARRTGQDGAGNVGSDPAEEQRATDIWGALDNKEQQ